MAPELAVDLSKPSPASRELPEARSRGSSSGILRRAPGSPAVLSFAQERIWILQAWDPENPVYNRAAAFRLRGPLNQDALQRSVAAVIARHDALRAVYSAVNGVPALSTSPTPGQPFRTIQLTGNEDVEAALRREARRPFDLSGEPLLRATLFQTADADEHVLLFVSHHIAADRWSDSVIYGELEHLYAAGGDPAAAVLPETPIAYGDYAAWQRERIDSAALVRQQQDLDRTAARGSTLPSAADRPSPFRRTELLGIELPLQRRSPDRREAADDRAR